MTQETLSEWWFYHLSQSTLERSAGPLLEKCLSRGWRVLAISPDATRRAALDEALWVYDDESFLPHGQSEAEGLPSSEQPILISADPENENQAVVAFLMDGANIPLGSSFTRCMVMFEDGDQATRQTAREQFKRAKEAGHVTRYFQQKGRSWTEVTS